MNSDGQIHNGADDNASGVTAVMELARMFSQNKTQEKVNMFLLFSLPKKMVLLVLKKSRRCKIRNIQML